ncbi:MAG: adenylate/guanylate cyclase domain-containing protein [Gemmatimonadota bacterium]
MSRSRRQGLGLGVGVAVGVALLLLLARATPPMEILEARSGDLRARWAADPTQAHPDILLVAIDEVTLDLLQDEVGRWPWPRDLHGYLTEYLSAAGARLVLFDIGFFDPDLGWPEGDTLFSEAMAHAGNAVLPVVFLEREEEAASRLDALLGREGERALLEGHALTHPAPLPPEMPDFGAVVTPFPLLGQAAAGMGAINLEPDGVDGVSRRERLIYPHRGRLYPSLALAGARILDPERFGGEVTLASREIRMGDTSLPLDQGGLLLRWRGPYLEEGQHTYPVVPAYQILNSYEQLVRGAEPDVPLEEFQGKVVLVGLTGLGLFEARTTPVATNDPGLMIHAAALDNLLSGDHLRRPPPMAEAVVMTVIVLLMGAGASWFSLTGGVLLLLVGWLGTVSVSFWAYGAGLATDLATPLLGLGLAFGGAVTARYVTEGRERRRIRDLFGRYVAPEYVRILEEDPDAFRLGGERVPLTLLFSDIRGFTSLSERLPAEEVVEILNRYLDRMAEIVFRHGGTLDKFMGDGLMAFWGAPLPQPDHARKAVEAGLEMLEAVETLNEEMEIPLGGLRLDIGVGVNTGEAVVGNMGSLTRKLDYTAVGDHVNLASRLEGLNKERGTRLLASHATWEALGDGFQGEELEPARVKGKEIEVRVHTVTRGPASSRKAASAPKKMGSVVFTILLAMAMSVSLTLLTPGGAEAQERARWTDRIYVPGSWDGGQVVPPAGGSNAVALVATVEGYAAPPRWRLELRRVTAAGALEEPEVVVGEGQEAFVLTALGSTSLDEHALGEDALVEFALSTLMPSGAPHPPQATALTQTQDGTLVRTVERQPAVRAEFSDDLLATGRASRLGRSLLRLTTEEVGDQRETSFAATAGARGVRVRTADGEVDITPDMRAIAALERRSISALELDRFRRDGGLGGGR